MLLRKISHSLPLITTSYLAWAKYVMSSKVSDFITLATQAAAESGIKVQFAPFTVGEGVQIVAIDDHRNRKTDLDRFLIELTSMADRKELGLQLALNQTILE